MTPKKEPAKKTANVMDQTTKVRIQTAEGRNRTDKKNLKSAKKAKQ